MRHDLPMVCSRASSFARGWRRRATPALCPGHLRRRGRKWVRCRDGTATTTTTTTNTTTTGLNFLFSTPPGWQRSRQQQQHLRSVSCEGLTTAPPVAARRHSAHSGRPPGMAGLGSAWLEARLGLHAPPARPSHRRQRRQQAATATPALAGPPAAAPRRRRPLAARCAG